MDLKRDMLSEENITRVERICFRNLTGDQLRKLNVLCDQINTIFRKCCVLLDEDPTNPVLIHNQKVLGLMVLVLVPTCEYGLIASS